MQTRANDRREFLRRLRSDPRFLWRHGGVLSAAVYRKVANRIRRSLADVHRGRKTWPAWLEPRRLPGGRAASGSLGRALPRYPEPAGAIAGAATAAVRDLPGVAADRDDTEDYFAENRWGFLSRALLAGATDREVALDRCKAWIESHTDKTDPAWEPYSTCERLANLLVFAAVTRPVPSGAASTAVLEAFIEESVQWLYRHLEYYGAAETNNHILNDARALAMAGAVTDNPLAVQAAVRILRRCLPEFVGPGGFLRERSAHYQLVALNWLLDAWRFISGYLGEQAADARFLSEYAERMAMAASMLCDGNGRLVALIGDVSPDATPAESADRLRLLYPEIWPAASAVMPRCQVNDGWFRLGRDRAIVLGNFPAGEYPPGFPTHGHCDPTSFLWRHDGRDILIDPGRRRYSADAVSLFQQSALAHNLPLINGFAPLCESVAGNGIWFPVPYASARLQIAECADGIELRHDGFRRCTPVGQHRRTIILTANGLTVADTFEGAGSVWLELCWHFAEDFRRQDQRPMWLRSGWCDLEFRVLGVPGTPSVRPACGAAPGGWVSRAYGEGTPALALRLGWCVELPAVVTTEFRLIVH